MGNSNTEGLAERAKKRSRTWDKAKGAARTLVLATTVVLTTAGSYLFVATEGGQLYNTNESPITALREGIKAGESNENLQMLEFIGKNTNTLKAEFKTVEQRGYVLDNSVLLNGLTDKGYWYQGGVVTDHGNNIYVTYEIWNDKGISIEPKSPAGMSFCGKVEFDKEVNLETLSRWNKQ